MKELAEKTSKAETQGGTEALPNFSGAGGQPEEYEKKENWNYFFLEKKI